MLAEKQCAGANPDPGHQTDLIMAKTKLLDGARPLHHYKTLWAICASDQGDYLDLHLVEV